MSAPCLRARLASSTRSPTLRLPRDPTTFQDHSAPLGRGMPLVRVVADRCATTTSRPPERTL